MAPLPVVVGRDVNLSRVESDLTDLDPATLILPCFDPPASYARSPSFHESDVVKHVQLDKTSTFPDSIMVTKACETVTEFCNPVEFLENFLSYAKEAQEKCPNVAVLGDECSQQSEAGDSKESIVEDLLVECDVLKSRRGRFLVWPVSSVSSN